MAYRIERDHFGGHIEEDREWELAGFNSFTDKEQEMYDRAAIPTFIIWGFLFFKDTHMDPHKAFDKYLLK